MNLQSKNVFVTGGAGFIGSTLARELVKEKANVVIYDNFLSGDLSHLTEIQDSVKIIEGDIIDPNLVEILRENEIEFVFNLAAEPYIPHCYDRPEKFFEVNANGTLNILLACKKVGIKRMLQYSTSEVYGGARYVPMDENHHTNPLSTYAVSKLAADRLCFTFYHEQNVPVVILRQFNTYGPRETQPYIIPELITQLSTTNKLKLGNINARRDFTYVEDAAKGAISLIKCDKAEGEVINLGSGEDNSIEELAILIAELMEQDNVEISVENERLRPLDVERLQCNYFKAHKYVGYNPIINLRDGLKRTIDWFKQNNHKWIWETKIKPEDQIWKGS